MTQGVTEGRQGVTRERGGAEVRHPEESVLVDLVSVKSQKNMLNIWSLVQQGEGSEGPLEGRS